ncbi:unnamed protein product, partial [Mesorhabditis spiculigera]
MAAGVVVTQVHRDDLEDADEFVSPSLNISGRKKKKKDKEKNRQSSSRTKPPRWGRWMQSFCCCMTPQQEIEPVRTNRGPLIPVVGGPGGSPNGSTSSTQKLQNNNQGEHSAAPTPIQRKPSTGVENLITQVNRDGTITVPQPTDAQKSESANIVKAHQQAHQITPNGIPVTHNSQGSLQTFFDNLKPSEKLLLPPIRQRDINKKCLVIDLDETLVHSSFKPVKNPDFVIPVEIDGCIHQVYVLKRPFVDEFLAHVGEKFECILFTASLAKYADPVSDLLDKRNVFRSRLFREACVFHKGNYVKDLARLGRDLNKTLIMDNSPASYAFHPENAIAVQTWFDDPHDSELLEVLPLLDRLADCESVYTVLRRSESPDPRSERSSS